MAQPPPPSSRVLRPEAPLDPQALDEWILGSDADRSSEESEEDNEALYGGAPRPVYFDWKKTLPAVGLMLAAVDAIRAEAEAMERALKYTPWPESNLYNRLDQAGDWKVVPLLYTFPAWDASRMRWVKPNCDQCPVTTALLKRIPGIRTALFSRMGPNTRLSSHRGWADLANHVLRCHLPLRVPTDRKRSCGLWVEGQIKHHSVGELVVFDDSCLHKAFNSSPTQERVVLIFDVLRPEFAPPGRAKAGHTPALDQFIQEFEKSLDLLM